MSDIFLGEVRAMPFGFAPRGWAPCEGQLVPIARNRALFTLIQATYGGDGRSNFGLPKLAPLAAKTGTLQYCIATEGTWPQRPDPAAAARAEGEAG
jgi:microcystin-dependent protein